jgi:DNA-binding NarL/FixJ family response regulator
MMALSKNLCKTKKEKENRYLIVGNNNRNINLCIISDSDIMRDHINSIIENMYNIDIVYCKSPKEYFENNIESLVDIVITDIEFENKIDTQFIAKINSKLPDTKIIVYTNLNNYNYGNKSLYNGADFFIFWEEKYNLLEHVINQIANKIFNKLDELKKTSPKMKRF